MPRTAGAPPVIVAVAGPDGAGKTTFYRSFLTRSGLRFVNADDIARDLELDAYRAAAVAEALRRELVRQRVSFIFETVFSDPDGEKVDFLKSAAMAGYEVILCFIGLPSAKVSDQRVSMRVSQGGHDVPAEKLKERFPRTLANLKRALRELPRVLVFDNGDLGRPFRRLAEFEGGRGAFVAGRLPKWFSSIL